MNTAQTGARGEDAACTFLRKQGCQILARNWRRPCGEIDIVALEGKTLVFAEVKTRASNAFGGRGKPCGNARKTVFYGVFFRFEGKYWKFILRFC